jgi:peptide/nickel transport system substrate-binding protein
LPPELDERLPPDRGRAKKLLAEAGYPDGFEVTLDCPNNRYINDEAICTSLAAMFAQIGVRAKLNVAPFSIFFPKVQRYDTSLFLLGWGLASADQIFTLRPILHSKQPDGAGDTNYGRFSDAKLDTWIDQAYVEMDQAKRKTAIIEALTLAKSAVFYLPLLRQGIPGRCGVT